MTMNRREHLLSETRIAFKFLEYMYMYASNIVTHIHAPLVPHIIHYSQ